MATSAKNRKATLSAKKLAAAVKALAGSPRIILQKRLAAAAVARAELGVRTSKDPYGTKWAPLTSRSGKPLRRTGNNIQRGWSGRATGQDTFIMGNSFKWLATHQYGAIIKPKRFPLLRFKLEIGRRVSFRKGKARRGAAIMGIAWAKSVTIPRRQMIPEMDTGGLGKIWLRAFNRVTRRFLEEQLDAEAK